MTAFYYAVERTKLPMMASFSSISLVFLGSYILVEDYAQFGLALASSIALSFNATVLFIGAMRYKEHFNWKVIAKGFLAGVGAAVVGYLVQGACKQLFYLFEGLPFKVEVLLRLTSSGLCVVGSFLFVLCLVYRKNPKQLIRGSLSKNKPPTPKDGYRFCEKHWQIDRILQGA